jgi:hypothetical protein
VRRVKASAARHDVRLPIATITRRVLQSYLLAVEQTGSPALPEAPGLRFAREEALIGEITRQLQDGLNQDTKRHAEVERRNHNHLSQA